MGIDVGEGWINLVNIFGFLQICIFCFENDSISQLGDLHHHHNVPPIHPSLSNYPHITTIPQLLLLPQCIVNDVELGTTKPPQQQPQQPQHPQHGHAPVQCVRLNNPQSAMSLPPQSVHLGSESNPRTAMQWRAITDN